MFNKHHGIHIHKQSIRTEKEMIRLMRISSVNPRYIVIIFDLECSLVEKEYPKQLPLSLPYKKKKAEQNSSQQK